MNVWAKKQTGFTIVELLIVVVVIAILAAITIVAYNGIQNRTRDSALQANAAQSGRKVLAYAPLNNDTYPDEANFRTALSLPADTAEATYDYYASSNGKAFCLSVTNTTTSPVASYATTQNGKTVQGRCVRNLVVNPSAELNLNTMAGCNACLVERSADWAANGGFSFRVTPNNTTNNDSNLNVAGDLGALRSGMEAGKTYTTSATIRLSAPLTGTLNPRARALTVWHTTSGGSHTVVLSPQAPNSTGIQRLNATQSIPLSPQGAWVRLYNGALSAGGDVWWDSVMITQGATLYSYGDGSLENWSWVGAPHASASFGPALAL